MFEGIALGSRLADKQLKINALISIVLALVFATSAPIGILIGVVMTTTIQPTEYTYLMAEGTLDALCSGVLVYVGLTLILIDFPRDTKKLCVGQYPKLRKFSLFISLWAGWGFMAYIGKYL